MSRCAIALSLLLLFPAWAPAYVVLNLDDSGPDSLRWCIEQANAHSASDTISFDATLAGGTITLETELPTLTGYYGDTIDGDVNGDGKPDFTLDAEGLGGMDCGLVIDRPLTLSGLGPLPLDIPRAPVVTGARIIGLSVVGAPAAGIRIRGRGGNTVRSCHIGANLAGDAAVPNHLIGIDIYDSDGNTVGGSGAKARNVIVCAPPTLGGAEHGVYLYSSDGSVIIGNHFGVNRAGTAALGAGAECLLLEKGTGTQIGGTSRNVFGGHQTGIRLKEAWSNRIKGNYFGLGSDGTSPVPLGSVGIRVQGGLTGNHSTGNRIGGTTDSARNVFAGPFDAILFEGAGTEDNEVLGNDFGATADGATQVGLTHGVIIASGAGAQVIGGSADGAGNHFTPTDDIGHTGVEVDSGGTTYVEGNEFGVLRSGTAVAIGTGLLVHWATVRAMDNTFARAQVGVDANEATVRVFGNRFRNCDTAVCVGPDVVVKLGDLGNASTSDDGGNAFRATNTWHIRNFGTSRVRAEGNSFDTTVRSEIDAKIWDKLDDPAVGRVDFIPLDGGVVPTGGAGLPALTVAGATAIPTAHGAEVAFGLSAPAEVTVTVLNVAGRPVATVMQRRQTEAGLQRVLWTGQTLSGTRAPAGLYLVRIEACDARGQGVVALARVALGG